MRASITFALFLSVCPDVMFAEELEFFGDPKGIENIAELKGHEGEVTASLMLPDGKLMTAGRDGTIRLWNVDRGKELEQLGRDEDYPIKLELINGRVLSFAKSGKITVWKLPQPKREWGPEQVTGSPDSGSGDQQTAWASATEDGQQEWLVLEYADSIAPVEVQIYENFNPGAVVKVTAFDNPESETILWDAESKPVVQNFGVLAVPVKTDKKLKRIKIYIDSPKVAGWNEIDAVGLVDAEGKINWAIAAAASSTYASRNGGNITYTR
jgi:WD40 repeat protein